MVWVSTSDCEKLLTLTEGYVPPLSALRSVYPERPAYRWATQLQPSNREEALAWIVTAYTQELVPYTEPGLQSYLPIETWMIGPAAPNNDGELDAWFDKEPHNTNYRIFIHMQPHYHEGRDLRPIRHASSAYRKLHIHHRKGPYIKLKRLTEPILRDISNAYRISHEAVASRIADTGHPFYFSRGLLER